MPAHTTRPSGCGLTITRAWLLQRWFTSRGPTPKACSGWLLDGRGDVMSLDISEQERDLLLELIETAEQTAIESMAHADRRSFKDVLRKRLELLTSTKEKIRSDTRQAA